MVRCEFDLCIYNRERQCALSCTNISPTGCCDDCIIPDIDSDIMDYYKKLTLDKYKK